MTSSHFFKVMIIQRQITWKWYNGTTYNGRPIESRIWSIEERHIQWHWTTPTQFQGHAISWRWISQKRYDIQTQCHWNTNRDLPTPYTTVSFRMILSDLEWLKQNIQWHQASRGLSATAELLVCQLGVSHMFSRVKSYSSREQFPTLKFMLPASGRQHRCPICFLSR